MQYLKPTFTLPAAPSKVTQEEWDRIFDGFGVKLPEGAKVTAVSSSTTFGQLLSNDNSDATGIY